ncbi:MAG: aldose epimerase family protein [Chthoniobacterales bacterium]
MFNKLFSIGLLGCCASIILGASGAYAAGLGVSKEPFGKMSDGTPVDKYTLTNTHGMTVTILTYGGIVQTIEVPDKNGKLANVSLGFDKLEDYIKDSPYFGAIIGRYGHRIAKGQFTVDGKQYQIPTNNGPNALHGGPKGFDKEVWAATPLENSNWVGVELTYLSPDGQMGFPGNLAVTVRYTLNNDNALRIDYSAVTDKDTILNLTNHTYFNLAGAGHGTVLDQVAMINADKITPVDKTLIPNGELQDVKDTPFDFTKPTAIGARIHSDNEQLKNAEPKQGGYDHNWVFNNPGNLNALAARVTDPESGRTVEMYTTEPGVQFYTGNFLDGSLKGIGGSTYEHWGAFTLEAQHYPDSPNHANFPSTELKPGEKYSQTTVYKFLPL